LPDNNGLPFGPHPHRGFATVTFILEGDLTHKDGTGTVSVINEGCAVDGSRKRTTPFRNIFTGI
jgi:hypothetical protein